MAEKKLKEWQTPEWAAKVNAEVRGQKFGTDLGATRPEVGDTDHITELPASRVVAEALKETVKK